MFPTNEEFKKQHKMSKPKTLWEKTKEALGIGAKFASATSVDGATYYYDGELEEGIVLFSDEEMTTPIAVGNYQLTVADGAVKLVTVGEGGAVTEIDDFVKETVEEMEEAFTSLTAEYKSLSSKYVGLSKENKELKERVAELTALNKAGKFQSDPKKGGQAQPKTASEMFKNRKK